MNPTPVRLIIPETNTVGIEDQAYLRGTKIAIDQMRVDEFHIEDSKTQNIRFQFGTSAGTLVLPYPLNPRLTHIAIAADSFYEAARSNNRLLPRPSVVSNKASAQHRELIGSQKEMH